MEYKDENIIFESESKLVEHHTEVLVVHCSADDYQVQFEEFCKSLNKRYARIAVPGGPHYFLAASYLPKFEWAGRRWTRFMLDKKEIPELICIAHEGCAWYREITIGPVTIPLLKNRQLDDLQKTKKILADMFPSTLCRLIYAKPNNMNHVVFVEL
ncbi:MAG: hypothetical protein HY001_04000 [Candidatus Portnoybacteria bacterium]|nr:hypothetical protein [Candidatus Portnoybacteria bacterium]